MGELIDFLKYRDEQEVERMQMKLDEWIKENPSVETGEFHASLEEMLKAHNPDIEEPEVEELPEEPEFSTSRRDHFQKFIQALWLAFRHLWRVIWGPNYEIFH